jgi:hypothetical protein
MTKKKIDLYKKKMALVAPQRQSHSQFEKVFFLDSLNFQKTKKTNKQKNSNYIHQQIIITS